MEFLLALLLCGIVFAWWYGAVYERPFDLIFLLLGIFTLTSTGNLWDNLWLIRLRHAVNLGLFLWVIYWYLLRRTRLSGLAWMNLALFGLIWISTLWTSVPGAGLEHKTMSLLLPVCFLLIGNQFSTKQEVRKFYLSLLVGALLVCVPLFMGRNMLDSDGRLSIHEINSNSIGAVACSGVMILASAITFCRRKRYFLSLLLPLLFFWFILLLTGSRTSFLAALGGVLILLHFQMKSTKELVFLGLLVIAGLLISLIPLDSGDQYLRVLELGDVSGRDSMWKNALIVSGGAPWYGCGFIPYYSPETGELVWGGVLNIYLNIFLELRWLGVVVGGATLCCLLWKLAVNIRNRTAEHLHYVVHAMIACGLLHGFCEASAMRGSSLITLLFMVSVGLAGNLARFRADAVEGEELLPADLEGDGRLSGAGPEKAMIRGGAELNPDMENPPDREVKG